jgi:hypothetical protein
MSAAHHALGHREQAERYFNEGAQLVNSDQEGNADRADWYGRLYWDLLETEVGSVIHPNGPRQP